MSGKQTPSPTKDAAAKKEEQEQGRPPQQADLVCSICHLPSCSSR